jgi:hypothetical protein
MQNTASAKTQNEYEYEWPTNPHAEEVVLGNAMQNWLEVRDRIGPDLFWNKTYQRIFRAMSQLEDRGEPVDQRTLLQQLERDGLQDGDLSVLVQVETVPVFRRQELDGYIRSLENVRTLRKAAIHAQKVVTEACISGADIRNVERSAAKLTKILSERGQYERDAVVIELPLTWGYEASMSYLVEELLIENAVTMWSGESGDGKSTLALALAAAVAQGQPFLGRRTIQRLVLYMDRENRVAIINERQMRLGIPREIQEDGRLKIWGTWWTDHYPPGPADGSIIAHAQRVKPLIVWDSLVAFADADENSSTEMRAHLTLYRRLASLGATILIIHHRSEKGEAKYRGSSDIRAAVDAAWGIARDDGSSGAEALGRMRLNPYKTRNQPGKAIRIEYRNGAFVPLDGPARPAADIVISLVVCHPGATQKELLKLAEKQGVSFHQLLAALEVAILAKRIEVRVGRHNTRRHYLPDAGLEQSA